MARMSVDASTTQITTSMPKGTVARSTITAVDVVTSAIKADGTGGNPMAVLEWTVSDGPFTGRRVGFHNVMLGGVTKAGNPMPLRELCSLIDAVKAPWATSADKPLVSRPFKRVKQDNGNILFIDPDTGDQVTNIDMNFPDDFLSKDAKVRFGVRKQLGSDREYNEVSDMMPLD